MDDTNVFIEGMKQLRVDPADYLLDMIGYWYKGMTYDQWALMFFSGMAILLVTDRRPAVQRWGPVFGLLSQPFWLYTAWMDMAGGIFVMSVFYTVMWIRGIMNGFFTPATSELLWYRHPEYDDIYVERAAPHRWSWPDSPWGPRRYQDPSPVPHKPKSFFDEPGPIRHYDDPRREP